MPRPIRKKILYDGCYAHVYSRALDKRYVYQDEEDFEHFKQLMLRTKREYAYRIHHYCLMNTHFHLIVSLECLEAFSSALKELKQCYAKWYQKKSGRKGPVWWGRFGSQRIESEMYMRACGMYVELNPVKAGMVRRPEDWVHSSSRHYFLGQKDELVDEYERPDEALAEALVGGLNVGRGSYIGTPLFLMSRRQL